ncbi:MAG: tetratricopeptide repeat protein [Verrucomicrobiota bacterium]
MLLPILESPAAAQPPGSAVLQRQWFATRTAHFNVFSCASPPEIYRLTAQLEQFCQAYSLLAGAQAVASPPIVVLVFPDESALRPFLPLYNGQPANLSGFFRRDSDENLIVLSLQGTNSAFTGLEVIFHEYAHLLFRQNARIWPLWLNEGIAELYSTFETTGYTVRIGKPLEPYLRYLARRPLMPLSQLFAVTRESPEYNEKERQGIFYAESWLLTHLLTAGGSVSYQTRFGQFTKLLQDGQPPVQAFTNALRTTLPAVEADMRRYLERGQFLPLQWALPMTPLTGSGMTARYMPPAETCCRLGDELMRIDRTDAAESWFLYAQKIDPTNALPIESLGLLAAQKGRHAEAVRLLKDAFQHGADGFLAHYVYAREKYRLTADNQDRYAPITGAAETEIRSHLRKSIALMPSFGPAHQLLGFFETVQAEDLAEAQKQLALAIQLEPDNSGYLISLAQAQIRARNPTAARQTLRPLLLSTADPRLRADAEELLRSIGH